MTIPLRIVSRVILFLSLFFVFDLPTALAQEDNPSVPVELNTAEELSTQQRDGLAAHKLERYFQELPQAWQAQLPSNYAVVSAEALSPRSVADVNEWSLIALQAVADGNWEIFVATADGQYATRLTNHPESDVNPSLIPGAYRVVFTSFRDGNSEIYTINLDGSGLTRLTTSPESDNYATWSPNGQELLFSSRRDGHWQLYRMNADGSNQVRMTVTDPTVWDFMPAWSPNGSQIAWVRATSDGTGTLWVMNADGSNARQIGSACKYLQNPTWHHEEALFADCDLDNDYFNEIGSWLVFTGGPFIYLDLGMWVDAWMGNFEPRNWPASEDWMNNSEPPDSLFTSVRYAVEGNQVMIADVGIYRADFAWNSTLLLPGAVSPHWETADIWAPQTWFSPLPKYSRQGTTVLEINSRQIGPARARGFTVERKSNLEWDNEWSNLFNPSNLGQNRIGLPQEGVAGYPTFFRVRGTDEAGNVETWTESSEGDAKTMYYAYEIDQSWTDNRNIPIYDREASFLPAPVGTEPQNTSSTYTSYIVNYQAYQINASTPFTVYPYSDLSFHLYAPADDDLVQNGNFETSLAAWQADDLMVSPTQVEQRVENNTALLGRQCPGICLAAATDWFSLPQPEFFNFDLEIEEDSQGTLHVLYGNQQYAWYTNKALGENWTQPLVLYPRPGLDNSASLLALDLTIDGNDVLYATLSFYDQNRYKMRLPDSGDWVDISPPDMPWGSLQVSRNGTVFLGGFYHANQVGTEQGHYFSIKESVEASWSEIYSLPIPVSSYGRVMYVATPDGSLHIFEGSGESLGTLQPVTHYVLNPNGQFSQLPTPVEGIVSPGIVAAISDPMGQIHLLISSSWSSMYYLFRDLNGQWSKPYLFDDQSQFYGRITEQNDFRTGFWSGRDGTLHYVANDMFYRYKLPGDNWSEPVIIHGKADSSWSYNTKVFVDSRQKMHIIQPPFYQVSTADLPYSPRLAQPVTIAASMHKPTLAFNYQLPYTKMQDPAPLWVDVTDSMTTTTVYSATGGVRWQLGWADMTPWLGQTITVTFRTDDTPGAAQVFLDNVSLSSWKTPIVHSVTKLDGSKPRFVQTGQQTTLLIEGENFISTPTVKIGDSTIQHVTYRNETQLEVVVPADFAEGIYSLQVVNPGGASGFSAEPMYVGNFLFLSNIFR